MVRSAIVSRAISPRRSVPRRAVRYLVITPTRWRAISPRRSARRRRCVSLLCRTPKACSTTY
eukprot:scaffold97016_cov60-Phaeocystis_antarctica.AAC.2